MEGSNNFINTNEQKNIPSKDLEATLLIIEGLLSESEDKVKEFITKRLEHLEAGSTKETEISTFSNPLHKGYISKETGVRRNMMVEPMYLNDESLYKDFVDIFKQLRQNEQYKSVTSRQMLMTTVQLTMQKYFGNMLGYNGVEGINRKFYSDNSLMSDEPSKPISINDFKLKNMAVCAERASAAQNLLSFAGLDSYLLMSGNCRLSGEESGAGHVFNVTQSDKGYFIFDPTNPVLSKNKDGKLLSAQAAIYAITADDFEKLKTKQDVTVEHKDIQIDAENKQVERVTKRIYGGVRNN